MRVAILSTFPPTACGIGEYAEQQARALEAQGHTVERLRLEDLRTKGWRGGKGGALREALEAVDRADRLIVHYQVGLLKDESRKVRGLGLLAPQFGLVRLLRRAGQKGELVVHESSYKLYRGRGEEVQWLLARRVHRAAHRLVFHTEYERRLFEERFFRHPRAEIRAHHGEFAPHATADQATARRQLGLPVGPHVTLCIGFYTPFKGFAEFADAFKQAVQDGVLPRDRQLHIVTSVRVANDHRSNEAVAALEARWKGDANVHVHNQFVPADAFDLWILASDVVALPYTATFSSGVAARARLLGRRILAAAVGGLPEQLGPGDLQYDGPEALRGAFRELAAPASATAGGRLVHG